MWVYDTKAIIDKLEKQINALKEENQELKEKIDKFTPHLDDDLNYIDGHYCYREIEDTTINKAKWKDGGLELALECRIIYLKMKKNTTTSIGRSSSMHPY